MALIAKRNSTPSAPVGQYAAVCVDVYDAGFWENLDGGEIQKCKVVFYLGKDETDGRDLYIDLFETFSLGKKANLTKWLTSWHGELSADETKDGFDLERLVGKTALVSVISKPKQDGTPRTVIGALMPLPRAMQVALPGVPEKYTRDCDREEQFADKHPRSKAAAKPNVNAPTVSSGVAADVRKAFDLQDKNEDDDLPF